MLCANGIHNQKSSWMAGWSASSTKGLHQMMDSHANDLISSHRIQEQEHTSQMLPEQQPHQTIEDDLMVNGSSHGSFDNIYCLTFDFGRHTTF